MKDNEGRGEHMKGVGDALRVCAVRRREDR